MSTPSTRLERCSNSARIVRADRSGSRGKSSTCSTASFPGPATLEWSMPALAQMKPRLCSTMMVPARTRRMFRLSPNMSSTRRGSFSAWRASWRARGLGDTVARLTMRPSALLTIFCPRMRISPSCKSRPLLGRRERITSARSSPDAISGTPCSGVSTRDIPLAFETRDPDAGLFGSIGLVDMDKYADQPFSYG